MCVPSQSGIWDVTSDFYPDVIRDLMIEAAEGWHFRRIKISSIGLVLLDSPMAYHFFQVDVQPGQSGWVGLQNLPRPGVLGMAGEGQQPDGT